MVLYDVQLRFDEERREQVADTAMFAGGSPNHGTKVGPEGQSCDCNVSQRQNNAGAVMRHPLYVRLELSLRQCYCRRD